MRWEQLWLPKGWRKLRRPDRTQARRRTSKSPIFNPNLIKILSFVYSRWSLSVCLFCHGYFVSLAFTCCPAFAETVRLGCVNIFIFLSIRLKERMGNEGSSLSPSEAKALEFTDFSEEELRKLHRRFSKIDTNGSGTLTTDEFFSIPELAVNPLLERIIDVLDTNKDKEIQFSEFIQALATFTNKDNLEGKLKFLFQVYDMDNDGFISNGELFQVLKMMVGNNLTDIQLQNIVDKTIIEADEDGDGKLSYPEFVKMIQDQEEIGAKLTITLFS